MSLLLTLLPIKWASPLLAARPLGMPLMLLAVLLNGLDAWPEISSHALKSIKPGWGKPFCPARQRKGACCWDTLSVSEHLSFCLRWQTEPSPYRKFRPSSGESQWTPPRTDPARKKIAWDRAKSPSQTRSNSSCDDSYSPNNKTNPLQQLCPIYPSRIHTLWTSASDVLCWRRPFSTRRWSPWAQCSSWGRMNFQSYIKFL